MQDRTLLRIGAVWLIVGFVLDIVHTALHPFVFAEPGNTEPALQSIVDSPMWAGIHVPNVVAVLLYVGGLLALYRSITGEPGAALARLGFAVVLMGAALVSVAVAIEGSGAMKVLADAWAAAADKAVPFAVAEAMLLVSMAIGFWGSALFWGVAPILYGLAIALTDFYPKWLGWVAVVAGAGNALIGIVVFDQGLSQVANSIWAPFSIAIILWLLVMGVLMWRKAGAAA